MRPTQRSLPSSRSIAKPTPDIRAVVGTTAARMNRRYIEESDVGNLFADAFVTIAKADVGFVHSGSLRKDLPGGDVRVVDLLGHLPVRR